MSDELAIRVTAPNGHGTLSIFNNAEAFRQAAEMAQFLAKSTLVPKEYQNNPSNAMIAIDIANRIGASPLMVMQNLYVIHGKPSWSSSFIISAINSCGRFKPLQYDVSGDGDGRSCVAWTTDTDGHRLEGPPVSIEMAKKEGWWGKQGSKWPTMTDLMLRYRAAAFFGRLYCPDILNGMYTADEVADFTTPEPRPAKIIPPANESTPAIADRESGDDDTLRTSTMTAIMAAMASMELDWANPDSLARASKVIGRTLEEGDTIDSITETEGKKLIAALNAAIAAKAKGPK